MLAISNHLDQITENLPLFQPRTLNEAQRRAAVAAILRKPLETTEILFIRRSRHPQDPWSGQMAFPGGRVDDVDSDPRAAALRETREEVHLNLREHGELLSPLSHLKARARGKFLPLVIEPFLFRLHGDPSLRLSTEVDETLWIPLDFFLEPANRTQFSWQGRGNTPLVLPCYEYGQRRIWGLTLQMLDEVLALTRQPRATTS